MRNPDVTVRSARRDGEVHLLRAAHPATRKIEREDGRPARSRDGEIVTACQQACPTRGDRLRRPERSEEPRSRSCRPSAANYALLAELNTQPAHDVPGARAQPEPGARAMRWPTAPQPDADDQRSTPQSRLAGHRAGHTFALGHRQDQLDRAERNARRCGWYIGFAVVVGAARRCCCVAITYLVVDGHRHLGQQPARSAGPSTSPTSSGGSASATPAR